MSQFRSRVLFHTHVDKTAGTSLIHGLRRSLGHRHVLDLRSSGAKPLKEMTTAEKAQIWVVSGHIPYGLELEHFTRPKAYLGCVRSPFERFRSYIQYIKPGRQSWAYVMGKSFPEVIEDYLQMNRPQANNQMARMLSGSQNPTFAEARANIDAHYLLVSPHMRVNEALRALATVTGGKTDAEDLHRNKQPDKAMADPGAWEARFNAANQIDTDLVAYVEDRFDHWVETIADRWATIRATKNPKAAQIVLR